MSHQTKTEPVDEEGQLTGGGQAQTSLFRWGFESLPLPDPTHAVTARASLDEEDITGAITNSLAKTTIGLRVNLQKLAGRDYISDTISNGYISILPNSDYQLKLYRTGEVIVTGVTSAESIITSLERVHGALHNIGVDSEWHDITISNVVVSSSLPTESLNLNAVSVMCDDIIYEPEQFAGATFQTPHWTVNLYSNGSAVITGVTTTNQAMEARENIIQELEAADLL